MSAVERRWTAEAEWVAIVDSTQNKVLIACAGAAGSRAAGICEAREGISDLQVHRAHAAEGPGSLANEFYLQTVVDRTANGFEEWEVACGWIDSGEGAAKSESGVALLHA